MKLDNYHKNILNNLFDKKELHFNALKKATNYPSKTLTKKKKELEAEGLIELSRTGKRRSKIYKITKPGSRALFRMNSLSSIANEIQDSIREPGKEKATIKTWLIPKINSVENQTVFLLLPGEEMNRKVIQIFDLRHLRAGEETSYNQDRTKAFLEILDQVARQYIDTREKGKYASKPIIEKNLLFFTLSLPQKEKKAIESLIQNGQLPGDLKKATNFLFHVVPLLIRKLMSGDPVPEDAKAFLKQYVR